MADDESGKEQPEQGEDEFELTPEQVESLRRTMDQVRRSLAPRIKLSESMLRNFAAVSRITESQQALVQNAIRPILAQQSVVRNAIKPIIDAQATWQKQFTVINSDFFKSHALMQSNLNLLASQLTKNVDFGATQAVAKVAAQFAAQQSALLKNLGPTLAALKSSFYPPNLRGIEDLRFEEVEEVVMVDGIALYGVPRAATAEALIRADGASKRRGILGRRWKSISTDCREAVTGCGAEAVAGYTPFALAALDALDAGHTAAAQALAGSLVDAMLNAYFGKDRYKFTPDKNGKRTKDAYDEFSVRQFTAFAPMWQTYQQFWVENGDPIPTTFSRNATAHTVSKRQFSRRNAVQGVLFASSVIYYLNEHGAKQEAA